MTLQLTPSMSYRYPCERGTALTDKPEDGNTRMKPWGAAGGPDDEELRRLVEELSKTNQEIADVYGVTEATVRYWQKRANLRRDRPERLDHKADGTIPWVMNTAAGHHMDVVARLLRQRNQLKHGQAIPADVRARIEKMEEVLKTHGLVIDYDYEQGFITRARDKQDSPDTIVRQPRS